MFSFHKITFLALILVSATSCHAYGSLNYKQDAVLRARNVRASANRFSHAIQKRGKVDPNLPDPKQVTNPTETQPESKDLSENNQDGNQNSKKDDWDPVQKLKNQIQKYKSDIVKLKKKVAADEAKLEALTDENVIPKSPKIFGSKNLNLGGPNGGANLLLENPAATPTTGTGTNVLNSNNDQSTTHAVDIPLAI